MRQPNTSTIIVDDPRSTLEVLAGFQRRMADLSAPDAILERLESTLHHDVGVPTLVVFRVGEDGLPTVRSTRDLPAPIAARCTEIDFLDPHVGAELTAGLGLTHHTWLMVSGGALFGAVVAVGDQALDPTRRTLAQALADAGSQALARVHTTAELERTIADLRASQEELARARTLEVLGQMAAVVAHEVRNPLASISGVLQILRGRFEDGAVEQQMIDKVLDRLQDQNRLVTEILGFARPRKANREPTAIRELVDQAVTEIAQDPRHDGVEVTVTGRGCEVQVDRLMVRGVLDNLLLNACQAMDEQGRIALELSAGGGRCTLTLSDSGPGIPEEVRDTLFEPFVTTRSRGTGLGLAMAARVITNHGGTITVDDAPGGGARFTLVLPAF